MKILQKNVLENFNKLIKSECTSGKISKSITDNLYNICGTWRKYCNEPIYIIGLLEGKYDYYYIGINDKNNEIRFISCVCELEECNNIFKKFTEDEILNIYEYTDKYFNEHTNEKLLYRKI